MAHYKLPRHKTARIPVILCILVIIVFFAPMSAKADRSLDINSIAIYAELLPNASMEVTEVITIDFHGKWNGFYMKIPQGNSPINNVQVTENGHPYTFNPGSEYGPPGTFLTKTEGDEMLIDWSVDALNQTRTFHVSYTVSRAVSIHPDVAQFYRKFINEANGNEISSVKVYLTLPAGSENYIKGEDIRIWGHGPLNGQVNFEGDRVILWQIENLPAHNYFEGRVIMPTPLFDQAPIDTYCKEDALSNVLSEEQKWADEANRERLLSKIMIFCAAAIITITLLVVFIIWRRFGRDHKTSFDGDYYRDLPASYSPAELSVLWNFEKIKTQDLTATILDLARRKFLLLEEHTIHKEGFLGSKQTNTYRITFLPAPDPNIFKNPKDGKLKPHEEELISYLQHNIALGKDQLLLTDIEKHAKKHGESFHDFWKGWKAGIVAKADANNFFDDNSRIRIFVIIAGIIQIVLGFLLVNAFFDTIGMAEILSGVIFILSFKFLSRRSQTGQEDYIKWKAFKRFLQHFSQMEQHKIPSLIIWEHYLVYAVTLGVAKEVLKQLEIVFPNLKDGDHNFGSGWIYYGTYRGVDSLTNSFSNIENSIGRALSTAQAAASKSSSGSGGGGGFSGGGGGGGGGGSYGGR
ncbi:MAG: DUF2207 domain-containing protein [Anaerovoracaceae bacterium]|jgi:uncharacterized membrane protein